MLMFSIGVSTGRWPDSDSLSVLILIEGNGAIFTEPV
jgi:hypothetical protein